MKDYVERAISCPHCGQRFHLALDASNGDQDFYDECPHCCADVHLRLHCDSVHDHLQLLVDADDEQVY